MNNRMMSQPLPSQRRMSGMAEPEVVLMGNTIDCADACGLQIQRAHVAHRIDGRLYAPECKAKS